MVTAVPPDVDPLFGLMALTVGPPVTVTVLPQDMDPLFGLTPVTVGGLPSICATSLKFWLASAMLTSNWACIIQNKLQITNNAPVFIQILLFPLPKL
jgi:hypothetical protein